MDARIFETGSQQWVRFDDVGDALFTRDRDRASVIESTQLESYIRNYELEYVRFTLTLEPVDAVATPIVASTAKGGRP